MWCNARNRHVQSGACLRNGQSEDAKRAAAGPFILVDLRCRLLPFSRPSDGPDPRIAQVDDSTETPGKKPRRLIDRPETAIGQSRRFTRAN